MRSLRNPTWNAILPLRAAINCKSPAPGAVLEKTRLSEVSNQNETFAPSSPTALAGEAPSARPPILATASMAKATNPRETHVGMFFSSFVGWARPTKFKDRWAMPTLKKSRQS